jgi:hypothetical protein
MGPAFGTVGSFIRLVALETTAHKIASWVDDFHPSLLRVEEYQMASRMLSE